MGRSASVVYRLVLPLPYVNKAACQYRHAGHYHNATEDSQYWLTACSITNHLQVSIGLPVSAGLALPSICLAMIIIIASFAAVHGRCITNFTAFNLTTMHYTITSLQHYSLVYCTNRTKRLMNKKDGYCQGILFSGLRWTGLVVYHCVYIGVLWSSWVQCMVNWVSWSRWAYEYIYISQ